ncbi:hypothetical protein E2C01_019428 [Portunus trituberculatus]|uniref:Uncharacterized protein n=1 Tax=Portunus trituberculatus TaxID=210409 RepID=A0A5B7DX66_PORTR|nr:hypothetical protein [Portunus trituberculatus]
MQPESAITPLFRADKTVEIRDPLPLRSALRHHRLPAKLRCAICPENLRQSPCEKSSVYNFHLFLGSCLLYKTKADVILPLPSLSPLFLHPPLRCHTPAGPQAPRGVARLPWCVGSGVRREDVRGSHRGILPLMLPGCLLTCLRSASSCPPLDASLSSSSCCFHALPPAHIPTNACHLHPLTR